MSKESEKKITSKTEEKKVTAMSNNEVVQIMGGGSLTLTDKTEVLALQTTIAAMWGLVKDYIEETQTTTILGNLIEARTQIITCAGIDIDTDAYYDADVALVNSIRTLEKQFPTGLKNLVKNVATAIDKWSITANSQKLKSEYTWTSGGAADVAWAANFIELWQEVMLEELPRKLATFSGANYTRDVAGVTAATTKTALYIRPRQITPAGLKIESMVLTTPTGTSTYTPTTAIDVTQQAGDTNYQATANEITIDSAKVAYTGVQSITFSDGTTVGALAGDSFEIWCK